MEHAVNDSNAEGNVVRRVLFAPDLDAYDIAWGSDTEWKQRAEEAPSQASDAVATLALYWKYAWNVARSPHLTMRLVEEVAGRPRDGFATSFWETLLETDEFRISILGSQVLAYSSFYFAYEHFLTECCAIRLGKSASEMMGYAKISEAVSQAFDKDVEQKVWSDGEIEIARRARNSLVHNGGIPDQRLEQLAPSLLVDGYISIHPVDVESLFQTLKTKVDTILREW